VHIIRTIGSGYGMIFFKSPTVKFPAFVIQSLRNVPEFIIAQSALTAFMNKKKKHENFEKRRLYANKFIFKPLK